MQNQGTNATEKVVNLFNHRTKLSEQAQAKVEKTSTEEQESENFSDSMRRNAENADRLRRERLKANQSVLKSYRIKN